MRATEVTRPGFSLIELVIVVIIIGIVAAIASPRLSSASENAARNALIGSRATLQKAIDLYTIEHDGALPHIGAASEKEFHLRLTDTTDHDGTVNPKNGIFGPYIDKIPVNPLNGLNTIRRDGALAGANTHGWRYDSTTGAIEPDHPTNTKADSDPKSIKPASAVDAATKVKEAKGG